MSEYLRLLVTLMVAVNPAAVALAMAEKGTAGSVRPAWRTPVIAVVVATAIYAVLAWGASPLLDWLQIEPETFRIAAGIVVVVGGIVVLWRGRWSDAGRDPGVEAAIFPLAFPLLAGPWGLAAVWTSSVDHGIGIAIGAAAPAVVAAAALVGRGTSKGMPALEAISRLTGGLAVAIAAGLVVSGVRAI